MSSLKEYLKRYTDDSVGKLKKSKKKRKGTEPVLPCAGVVIVDDDVTWQKKPDHDDEEPPEAGEEQPAVVEDVEVKRMQRMEALKTFRPYLTVANDGSGWVTVREDRSKPASNQDSSPPRQRDGSEYDFTVIPPLPRRRNDSPDEIPRRTERSSPSEVKRTSTASYDTGEFRDLSPPRRRLPIRESAQEISPLQKKNGFESLSHGHDSPDESCRRAASSDRSSPPPRRRTPKIASDINEPQDLSPPRKKLPGRESGEEQNGSVLVSSRERLRRLPRSENPPDDFRRRIARTATPDTVGFHDLSPPRKEFPTRRSPRESRVQKKNGETFVSPRESRRNYSLDGSRRITSESDNPPLPRKASLTAPARNNFRDISPARMKLTIVDDAQELSPFQKKNYSTLMSKSETRRHNSPHDFRRRTSKSISSSPPSARRTRTVPPDTNESRDLSPPRKKLTRRMGDGTLAGLKTESEVVSEVERTKANEAKFVSELDPTLSGRGARTVFRDKRGRRLEGLEEMLREHNGEEKSAEQGLEWGKGVAQKREVEAKLAELEAEKSKPFARYRDDAELDKSLKDKMRWGDPMAHLVKRKVDEPLLEDFGAREEMKASGFIVPQDIPNHSWIKRGIVPPPNRYGIKPGRHWDGVDRSTGFEQGLFKQKNEKKARELEAYLCMVIEKVVRVMVEAASKEPKWKILFKQMETSWVTVHKVGQLAPVDFDEMRVRNYHAYGHWSFESAIGVFLL